jgi:NDP-sugar pyrophosphorylase family protein
MIRVGRTAAVIDALQAGTVHGALLAGGAGNRMNAITDNEINVHARQKAVLPLGGHPICEYAIQPMLDLGLPKVYVFVGYLQDTVIPLLKGKYNRQVEFVEQREPYVNTAGNALRIINEALPDEADGTLIVRSGDIASNIEPMGPLSAQLAGNKRGATIVVNPVPWRMVKEFGTVLTENMPKKTDAPAGAELGELEELRRKFHQDIDVYYTTHRGTPKRTIGDRKSVV